MTDQLHPLDQDEQLTLDDAKEQTWEEWFATLPPTPYAEQEEERMAA